MAFSVNTLHDAIARIRDDQPDIDAEAIAGIVRSAVSQMTDEVLALRQSLFTEVAELGAAVAAAREEIVHLRHEGDLGENQIPDATDELDAIVEHTASATETILDACEQIDVLAATADAKHAAAVQDQTIRIFEACSFQDITGQRIGKVIATLKMVESRVARIVDLTAAHLHTPGRTSSPPVRDAPSCDTPVRDPLLNGPQAPHIAMDQAAIDRLLTF